MMKYKIELTDRQIDALNIIDSKKVLFDDNYAPPMISVRSYEEGRISGSLYIDWSVFNALEMMGILFYRRYLGAGLHIYRVDRRYFQKVINYEPQEA